MISRDKSLLCPAFVERLNEMERELEIDHLPFKLFEGFRSFERQEELYAQGRTAPGEIVTQCHPGDSIHQYVLAGDMVKRIDGQWSWDNRDGLFDRMGAIAEDCGLIWGGHFRHFIDRPHVEMPGLRLQEIKEIYRQNHGDLKALWTHYR